MFGAGLMGAGIAQVAAMNGVKVVMTDVSEGALENGSVYNFQLSTCHEGRLGKGIERDHGY